MRIAVALSGGVDSSVAALILKGQRHDVFGLTMTFGDLGGRRSAEEAVEAAARVAGGIGIEHHRVDVGGEFEECVVSDLVESYAAGLTPNPCVRCNRHVKFGRLMDEALAMGADLMATGHHARVLVDDDGRATLLRGADPDKDQSYFLYDIRPSRLSRIVMPVGEMTKKRVRGIAREAGLVPNVRESVDVCFLDGGPADLVAARVPGAAAPGPIVNAAGDVLGEHSGIAAYTVGQRSGLGLPGPLPSYVLSIDATTNTIVVGTEDELYTGELRVTALNWLSGETPCGGIEAEAQIRYSAPPAACTVRCGGDGAEVRFREPQRAVCPGQAVVFYEGDRVLGGGTIVR